MVSVLGRAGRQRNLIRDTTAELIATLGGTATKHTSVTTPAARRPPRSHTVARHDLAVFVAQRQAVRYVGESPVLARARR